MDKFVFLNSEHEHLAFFLWKHNISLTSLMIEVDLRIS